jgi:hypothetical protein
MTPEDQDRLVRRMQGLQAEATRYHEAIKACRVEHNARMLAWSIESQRIKAELQALIAEIKDLGGPDLNATPTSPP